MQALLDARLKHLKAASEQLIATAPTTAAHLQAVRRSVIENTDVASTPTADGTCAACGNILIRGWSCKIPMEDCSNRTRTDRLRHSSTGLKELKLRCHKCSSVNTVQSKKSRTSSRRLHKSSPPPARRVSQGVVKEPSKESTSIPDVTAGGLSRKRPRGKKESLQSIIQHQNVAESSKTRNSGLTLADLMKP